MFKNNDIRNEYNTEDEVDIVEEFSNKLSMIKYAVIMNTAVMTILTLIDWFVIRR